jgi:anti-sigma regulatory factor (Ser/Thr protein kinase)
LTTEALSLEPVASSVPQGRRFVVALLEGWGLADLSETAALLTTEVLTNSVVHAQTPIELCVSRLDGAVHITVRDLSRVLPVPRSPSAMATTGRGLRLLADLAQSWDVSVDTAGKTLSFTVAGGVDPWAAFRQEEWLEADL